MKNLLLTLLALSLSLSAFAQAGIYKTYDDFVNDNITAYRGKARLSYVFGGYAVIFNTEGESIKYDLRIKKMWGFRTNDKMTYRINKKKQPYYIAHIGTIVYYTNYTTKVKGDEISFDVNSHKPMISLGLDGEMIELKSKNVRELLSKTEEGRTYLKKYKLKSYRFDSREYTLLYEYIAAFNKYAAD